METANLGTNYYQSMYLGLCHTIALLEVLVQTKDALE